MAGTQSSGSGSNSPSQSVLVQQPNGEQYWKKPQDVKPNDTVLHGSNTGQAQAQQLVDQSRAAGTPPSAPGKSVSGSFSSPQEAEGATKSMVAGGWNVKGLEQDPNTGKWGIVAYGKKEPDFAAQIKNAGYMTTYSNRPGVPDVRRALTPDEKARLIQAETQKQAENYEISWGPVTGGGPKIESDLQKNYVYNMNVDYPEQVQDVRAWAQKQGYRVSNVIQNPDKTLTVELTGRSALSEKASVDIRSGETIEQARQKGINEQTTDALQGGSKGFLGQAALYVRTLISPAGEHLIMSHAIQGIALFKNLPINKLNLPVQLGSEIIEKAINYVSPGIRTPDELVKENTNELADNAAQHLHETAGRPFITLPGLPNFKIVVPPTFVPYESSSAIFNPFVEAEMAYAGGALLGAAGATAAGGRILGSTAGKAAGYVLGAGSAAQIGLQAIAERSEGKGKALGTLVFGAIEFGVFAAGYHAYNVYSAANIAAKPVKVEISGMKGASVTRPLGEGSITSTGAFEITEGEFTGLKGRTAQISGKKGGYVLTHIPEQKVGKVLIPEQVFRQFTKGGTLSDPLKIYWKTANTGVVIGEKVGKAYGKTNAGMDASVKIFRPGEDIELVGPSKEATILRKTSEKPGKANGEDVMIRRFKGVGVGTEAAVRTYDLFLVKAGDTTALVEASAIARKAAVKIEWVDVSLAGGRAGSGGRGGVTKIQRVMPEVVPPTPPSTMNIDVKPATASVTAGTDLVARIVANVNPTAYPLRIKENKAAKPVDIASVAGVPQIIRRESTAQKGRTVSPANIVLTVVPNILRPSKTQPIISVERIAITHPITGQDITVSQKTAIMQVLNPIIERIASQPVNIPAPATPTNKRPKFMGGIGLVPFLRMGNIKLANLSHRTDVKLNPVPDILKVI
ncbi:MAG: hypothetical protein NTU57_02660 [Candidatus Aenigmarchaeota archaeon]|nr:hypothetical protein [Candidatus Aenigmarchaeota archaeon]